MSHFKKILFATDFSEHAAKARSEAERLARKHDAELHVLHVEIVALQGAGGFLDQPVAKGGAGTLAPDESKPTTFRTVFHTVRDSSEAAGVLRYATESRVDLIVIGTRGRNALAEAVFGSVAQEVVHSSPVSVLVVGPACPAEASPVSQVLAPIDFSAGCRAALIHAACLTKREQAKLTALHVVDFRREAGEPVDMTALQLARHDQLDRFVTTAHLPLVTDNTVRIGPAAEVILKFAIERQVGLIVMPPSRHNSLERLMMLGGVSRAVVRHAPCPVLIYREPVRAAVQEAVPAIRPATA